MAQIRDVRKEKDILESGEADAEVIPDGSEGGPDNGGTEGDDAVVIIDDDIIIPEDEVIDTTDEDDDIDIPDSGVVPISDIDWDIIIPDEDAKLPECPCIFKEFPDLGHGVNTGYSAEAAAL